MSEQKEGQQQQQEIQQQHTKLKNEFANIFKVCFELEEEKKEHNLVSETIKDLNSDRKCWRLVGGALVEKTVGEVLPSLQQNIQMLDKAIENYQQTLNAKEKEILEFEKKHNLKNERKMVEEQAQQQQKSQGVLA